MKIIVGLLIFVISILGCNTNTKEQKVTDNAELAKMLAAYFDERMSLYPIEAAYNGDKRFNNQLPAEFTDSYTAKLISFYNKYQKELDKFDPAKLNDNDKKSHQILAYEINMSLEGLNINKLRKYMPFDQFNGVPLTFGQMGSGTGLQPFKTVKDYDNWIQRATAFSVWADSAILYFKKGIENKYVLPRSIVVKIIPQMYDLTKGEVQNSMFYGPVKLMPDSFPDTEKNRLTIAYHDLIKNTIMPTYKKLGDFFQNEYLPKASNNSGIGALPGGARLYAYLVRHETTTNMTPNEIYETGLQEVARIRGEMEKVKATVGFNGSLDSFFTFMKNDKQFMPFKTAEEVLNAYRKIQSSIDPNLSKLFTLTPKTKFEIRQTEAFRAASASAEYYSGLPDGSRPGIFYVPIVDATQYNTTSGMESLFLHEAIPGHHYQNSIQSENTTLPTFRKFIWYGAYGEGYALYCESLGKELGLYTDPYQLMGALGDEIHRAIRLVVDVALHTGRMNREEAIHYMMTNEAISEAGAIAEIERYMVYPGQALSYKIGALKIAALRSKYEKMLGNQFSLAAFHSEFLKDGCMPLEILEKSMDEWARKQ